MSKKKELTYDEALAELQNIVAELQEDIISIDDLSERAKRAAWLVKFCKERLRNLEEELGELFDGKGGDEVD